MIWVPDDWVAVHLKGYVGSPGSCDWRIGIEKLAGGRRSCIMMRMRVDAGVRKRVPNADESYGQGINRWMKGVRGALEREMGRGIRVFLVSYV